MPTETFLRFLPQLSPATLLAAAAALVVACLALRWLLGSANSVSRHSGLWLVRGAILSLVALLLINPSWVEHLPGPVQRPEVFYLLDTSSSMQMGSPKSRWDETLAMIDAANERAPQAPAEVKTFRFGQRLAAIDAAAKQGDPRALPSSPHDADSRLLAALRQISSRFGRVPPQAIVVFSDGRARDEENVAQLAAEFARLKVPIHVVPVGDTTKGGDVAVAAVVAPPRVRKFTEVEVQVFVRSFGYEGKRSEVRLVEREGNKSGRVLSSLPFTLSSGFQSVSLSFRTDLATRKLRIEIPQMPNEVSERNNFVDTEMAIDRTKIRVLYIEGSSQPLTTVRVGDRTQIRGAFTDLKTALTSDEDIECVVLADVGGRLQRISEYQQADGARSFPTTVAELAAFDAIILSNVSANQFTETQLAWLQQWIGQRGGGLCMVGGENSFASGGWSETPLAEMLPVEMLPGNYDWLPGEQVRIAPQLPTAPHAVWSLLADDKQNRQIVGTFPGVAGLNRWSSAKSNLASVLATTSASGKPTAPVEASPFSLRALSSILQETPRTENAGPAAAEVPAIVAGRYGHGRTLALAFPITSPYADELIQKWGQGDNRYYSKFARNLVYWLTESSAIGRRRLVAKAGKKFYKPGESISITAETYDESAAPTRNYRVVAMVEPHTAPGETEPETSPLRWPSGLPRESGEDGPFVAWGEEFELPLQGDKAPEHALALALDDKLTSGAASQSLRVELTAYEELTQVDSTSLDIQVLHDPFEQQNPFPNHDLLKQLAAASGGKVLKSPDELAKVLNDAPVDVGVPIVRRSPAWSNWWVLGVLLGLLTVEWCWRRTLGLA
jgi:uncharacterized membrane protein